MSAEILPDAANSEGNQKRNSGIDIIAGIPWGSHFCAFYETPADLLDIIVPFFRVGLQANEFCLFVVFDPFDKQQAHDALVRAIPEASSHFDNGDIEIASARDCYLSDGKFSATLVADTLHQKLASALEQGYAGMRANGIEAWLKHEQWNEFVDYERKLNDLIADQRLIILCAYPLNSTTGAMVFDIARTHQFAVARRNGEWQAIETPELSRTKDQLAALVKHFEVRVVERTRELQIANERLRSISARIAAAREEERTRVAREIHDEIGSSLAALQWSLQTIRDLAPSQECTLEFTRRVDEMLLMTRSSIEALRRIVSDLRPAILDHVPLVEAIRSQLKQFELRTGIRCDCACSFDDVYFSADYSIAVFRILQEALTNVLRHAEATSVTVRFEEQDGELVLQIRDNGKGIPPDVDSKTITAGLWGMQERAHSLSGTLDVTGKHGEGTTVTLRAPLPEHRARTVS